MNQKSNKGITLIALVITIIVLLILAGVTINMVLGDDGIIQQAQQAKEVNEKGNEKDAIAIAKTEAATAQYFKQEALSFEEAQKTFTTLTEESQYNGNVAKVVDGVPIPLGFAHVQGTKKDTGLIVVDGYGNEFVWVPVENAIYDEETNPTGAFRKTGTGDDIDYKGKLYDWGNATVDESGNWIVPEMDTSYNEPKKLIGSSRDDNEDNKNAILESNKYKNGLVEQYQEEYNSMAKSVEIYGGFFVGRYETSWTGSKVASVKGAAPEKEAGKNEIFKTSTDLGVGWITSRSDNKATWYGLYKYQKELYNKDTDSVVSGMIYGSQWDAIINWMKDVPNTNSTKENKADRIYIKDSRGMGNYRVDGKYVLIATGLNDNYKVKNIYDLAGNYLEWTQEAYNGYTTRVFRGGRYNEYGDGNPVCSRSCYTNTVPTYSNESISSRLQLYIK